MLEGEIVEQKNLEDDTSESAVTFTSRALQEGNHWYSIHIQTHLAHTFGGGYSIEYLDYPWLIVNTSPWFVEVR